MRARAFWNAVTADSSDLLDRFLGVLRAHDIRYCLVGRLAVNAYVDFHYTDTLMPNRTLDGLRQAERDLEQAESSRRDERHEWACFAAHQAAEKAVRAVHLVHAQEAWGHTVSQLLTQLPGNIPPALIDRAKVLDNYYVPARYPNGHPEGAPFEHYGPLQSDTAITYAREILDFARAQVA